MKDKIVVCYAEYAVSMIQPLLDEGWAVKMIATESVSTGANGARMGKTIFILQK